MTKVLGLDVGGTGSRARLVVDGRITADVSGPSASPVAAGAGARAALEELLARIPVPGTPLDAVCVGTAGLSSVGARPWFEEQLAGLTDDGPVLVVEDFALVLPAAGLRDGVGVVCGTGSVAAGRHRDRRRRAGGWGYLLGDDGGGYWLARAAVRVVLERHDGGAPTGALTAALLDALAVEDIPGMVGALYADIRPRSWAALAPAVLGCDDPRVEELVGAAAEGAAHLVAQVLGSLHAPGPLPVVLAGGLADHARYRDAALAALRRLPAATEARMLTEPPVAGAVRLAMEAAAAAG